MLPFSEPRDDFRPAPVSEPRPFSEPRPKEAVYNALANSSANGLCDPPAGDRFAEPFLRRGGRRSPPEGEVAADVDKPELGPAAGPDTGACPAGEPCPDAGVCPDWET
jgi:hypothetical protein